MSDFLCNQNTTIPEGIINNDQGIYQNLGQPGVNQIPVLDLAFLSNSCNNDDSDVVINLNPICLKWCDFTTLFFTAPSGAFWINPSNGTSRLLVFQNQKYETTQNKCVSFSLVEQIKKAWSKKNAKNITTIPANVNILLNRAGFLTKSLAFIKEYVTGLSLDEAISTLLSNRNIEPGNSDTSATVSFVISYKDYFKPLNTSVLVNFTYVTKIPCYKNITDCFIDCSAYSKDCNDCRNYINDESVTTSYSKYKISNDESSINFSTYKKSTVDFDDMDDETLASNNSSSQSKTINAETIDSSDVMDELSKIIKSEMHTNNISKPNTVINFDESTKVSSNSSWN